MTAESLLAVTGLGALLEGRPRRVTVADAQASDRIPREIRRSVRRFMRGDVAGKAERPPFKYADLLDQLTREIPQREIDALIAAVPADVDLQVDYAVAVARALSYLRGAMPISAQMTTTGPISRRPSDMELSRFRRAWEIAESPLVAFADLEAGRLVPDQVDTLAAVYPQLYDVARLAVLEAIADLKAEKMSWRLPLARDRRLAVLLRTNSMTPDLAADVARAFAEKPPQQQSPPPMGGSSKTADAFQRPSQMADAPR